MPFASIPEAIEEIKAGRMIVLVDEQPSDLTEPPPVRQGPGPAGVHDEAGGRTGRGRARRAARSKTGGRHESGGHEPNGQAPSETWHGQNKGAHARHAGRAVVATV